MQVDSEVSRAKFDRELLRLSEQRSTLESRGIFVLASTAYPYVDVLMVPRHPVQFPVSSSQSGIIILPQVTLTMMDIPSLAARAFKARFDLSDFDLRAPSLQFLDPWTDAEIQPGVLRAFEFEKLSGAHDVLLADHPTTHKLFLCLRGIREYHEHPQHSGDDWLLYREKMGLFSIVMSLWRVSIDLARPRLIVQVNGIQVHVQIQWAAEERP